MVLIILFHVYPIEKIKIFHNCQNEFIHMVLILGSVTELHIDNNADFKSAVTAYNLHYIKFSYVSSIKSIQENQINRNVDVSILHDRYLIIFEYLFCAVVYMFTK